MNPGKKTIYTLETLLARTEEYGNCMEWTGYCQNKVPHADHNGKFMAVRRIVWELLGKEHLEKHYYVTSCGNKKCVNPDHVVLRPAKQHMKIMAKSVDHRAVTRLVKLREAAKDRRILTDDQVRDVLNDSRSTREIASELNVSRTLIARIKSGKSHKLVNAMNNPFWGLIA